VLSIRQKNPIILFSEQICSIMINTPEALQQGVLFIGIDKYPNLSKFAQFDGCVNDARLMASILKDHFGFPEDHLTLLFDEAATRDGILAAMHDLAEQVAGTMSS